MIAACDGGKMQMQGEAHESRVRSIGVRDTNVEGRVANEVWCSRRPYSAIIIKEKTVEHSYFLYA